MFLFNVFIFVVVFLLQGEIEVIIILDMGVLVIGDILLYQLYFVCLYEKFDSILIEYGKILGILDGGDIYFIYFDIDNFLNVCFYVFGNMNKVVKIWDVYIVLCDIMDVDCKGDIYKDFLINLCVQKCY